MINRHGTDILARVRMHPGQVDVTPDAVAALVAAQFPAWRGRPVRRVASHGTVNALFRVGEDVVLRFPLAPDAGDVDGGRAELVGEQEHARALAPHLPLPVPEPLAVGEPGPGYPGAWAAYRWLPGDVATPATADDRFARDLAGFVRALHAVDTGGRRWNGRWRGGPLAGVDADVRAALDRGRHLVATAPIAAAWDRCLAATPYDGPGVWLHADLMPGNLLVRDGRLAAVIDLGDGAVGDPAVDLMVAWNLLEPGPADAYRAALDVDDATWERGRGWAIMQALPVLSYYAETNRVMYETALHTLAAVLR